MNVNKIVSQLKHQYPNKKIILLPEKDPKEIICEIDPTENHPEYSRAIAVIQKSVPHFHRKSTETYKVLKGSLNLYINGTKHILLEGDTYEIQPHTIHWAEGDAAWVDTYSTPGWSPQDHILVDTDKTISPPD